jgi:hypothetical protein
MTTTAMNDAIKEYSNHIYMTPSDTEHGIGHADFEVCYQTSYKNSEIDIFIDNFMQDSIGIGPDFYNLDCLNVWRIVSNTRAAILKFLQLRKTPDVPIYSGIEAMLLTQHFSINETSSLLYAIRRTIDCILQIETNTKNYAIGRTLKFAENGGTDIQALDWISMKKQTLRFFKIVNLISNCLKHSLLHENCDPRLFPPMKRFFGVERLSLEDFDEKFNPKDSNPYFFWEADKTKEIEEVFSRIHQCNIVLIEYNVHITQVMISFLLFIEEYIIYALRKHYPDVKRRRELLDKPIS